MRRVQAGRYLRVGERGMLVTCNARGTRSEPLYGCIFSWGAARARCRRRGEPIGVVCSSAACVLIAVAGAVVSCTALHFTRALMGKNSMETYK